MQNVNFIFQDTISYELVQRDIFGQIEQELGVPPSYVHANSRHALQSYRDGVNLTLFARCGTGNVLMSHGVADKNYLFMREIKTGFPFVNRFDHVLVPGDWLKERLLATPRVTLREDQIHVVGWPRLDYLRSQRALLKGPRNGKKIRVLWAPTHDKRKRGSESESTSSYPAFKKYKYRLAWKYDFDMALHPRNRKSKVPTSDLLVKADVVISDFGTMVYEAWALGIPVIFPRWILQDRIVKYTKGSAEAYIFENNIGLHAHSYSELCKMIDSEIELGEDVKEFMNRYLPSRVRHHSARAIAQLLVKLVPRKELVLHIGSYKTATSFLQNTLNDNREVLKSSGVLYPKAGRTKSPNKGIRHYFLCKAVEKRDSELFDKLFSEIMLSGCDKIILSSERFTRLTDEQVKFLRNKLLNFNVKVVYSVRRQDELFESLYAEYVANNALADTPDDYFKKDAELFYFDKIARRWMGAFGSRNVSVVGFQEAKENGVLATVLNPINKSDLVQEMIPSKIRNLSLNAADTQLKFNLNCAYKGKKSGRSYLKKIGSDMAKSSEEKTGERLSLFTPNERSQFLAQFSESNHALFELVDREISELTNFHKRDFPKNKTEIFKDQNIIDEFTKVPMK